MLRRLFSLLLALRRCGVASVLPFGVSGGRVGSESFLRPPRMLKVGPRCRRLTGRKTEASCSPNAVFKVEAILAAGGLLSLTVGDRFH
jgi:hypothetical protein